MIVDNMKKKNNKKLLYLNELFSNKIKSKKVYYVVGEKNE